MSIVQIFRKGSIQHATNEVVINRNTGKLFTDQTKLPTQVTARHPRGTRPKPLPLLPSGPDGVRGCPLRGTRLSLLPAIIILLESPQNKKTIHTELFREIEGRYEEAENRVQIFERLRCLAGG